MVLPVLPHEVPVVLGCVRDALAGVRVRSLIEADFFSHLPYVHLRFGAAELTMQPHTRITMPLGVDVYHGGSDSECRALARQVFLALWSTWKNQTPHSGGHISAISTTSGPVLDPIPGLPAGVYQYTATYQLGIRPPSATP